MMFLWLLLLLAVAVALGHETFSRERAMAEAAKILKLMGTARPTRDQLEQLAVLVEETGMTAESVAAMQVRLNFSLPCRV